MECSISYDTLIIVNSKGTLLIAGTRMITWWSFITTELYTTICCTVVVLNMSSLPAVYSRGRPTCSRVSFVRVFMSAACTKSETLRVVPRSKIVTAFMLVGGVRGNIPLVWAVRGSLEYGSPTRTLSQCCDGRHRIVHCSGDYFVREAEQLSSSSIEMVVSRPVEQKLILANYGDSPLLDDNRSIIGRNWVVLSARAPA